jgi:hypothetical protein
LFFINTSLKDQRAFILKKPKDPQLELDHSEDIICASIIDCYLQRPANIEHIFLAKFASSYTKKGKKQRNSDMPYVIRYVRYSEHKDDDNFYREQLLL